MIWQVEIKKYFNFFFMLKTDSNSSKKVNGLLSDFSEKFGKILSSRNLKICHNEGYLKKLYMRENLKKWLENFLGGFSIKVNKIVMMQKIIDNQTIQNPNLSKTVI